MNYGYLIDKINIKDLPEMITSYLRKYQIKKIGNLRGFYSNLFDYLGEDIKNSYLNRILKYLSSNISTNINIIDDFNEGIYDNELLNFSRNLIKVINNTENCIELYEMLYKNTSIIFFENNESYYKIENYYTNKEYDLFLFYLIKHSFETYKINLPGIIGNRILDEALTAYYDTEYRKRMIQASAELGNEVAINLHAAHIFRDNPNKAVQILLKNKNNASELWQIAFELEINSINKETFLIIKNELKTIIKDNEFTDKILLTEEAKKVYNEETLLYAVKMYYYIAEKFGFSKSFNSLGKLMIFNSLIYDNDRKKTVEIAQMYLKKAIKMGNVNATTNLSIYFYYNKNDEKFDFFTMKKLLEAGALLGDPNANCYYGKILIDEGNFSEGEQYLKFAAMRKNGLACFELGKLYELKNENKLSEENYKAAILNKYYDAAYNLTLLYLKINAISEKQKIPKDKIYYYLKQYENRLSDEIKQKALMLINDSK